MKSEIKKEIRILKKQLKTVFWNEERISIESLIKVLETILEDLD